MAENELRTANDNRFTGLFDKIIDDFHLEKGRRIALLAGADVGQVYFIASALTYAQQKKGVTFFVACERNSPAHEICKAFRANGAKFYCILLDEDPEKLYWLVSPPLAQKYLGLAQPLNAGNAFPDLLEWQAPEDVRQNLSRPCWPENLACATDSAGTRPGKTALVIPHAGHSGTLRLEFWQELCRLLRLTGFHIFVHSLKNMELGDNVTCVYPAISEIVAFANGCDQVIGIRCGLTEMVAAETTARVVCINPAAAGPIERIYPFMEPGKITYWPIASVRSTGFEEMDRKISRMVSDFTPYFAYFKKKAGSDPLALFETAQLSTFDLAWFNQAADNAPPRQNSLPPFCSVKYRVEPDTDCCVFTFSIAPAINYEIHAFLRSAETGSDVAAKHLVNRNKLVFIAPKPGDYFIYFKIYHPDCKRYSYFETGRFHLEISPGAMLVNCREYASYIDLLDRMKSDCLIFIVSRDAHTNWAKERKLYLEKFDVALNPEQKFRYSWLAVIDSGRLALELAEEKKEIVAEYAWGENRAHLTSAGYNVHMSDKTPVSISINGAELAVNSRGLNIVVWDKGKNRLVDSVVFDTFLAHAPAVRLEPVFMGI